MNSARWRRQRNEKGLPPLQVSIPVRDPNGVITNPPRRSLRSDSGGSTRSGTDGGHSASPAASPRVPPQGQIQFLMNRRPNTSGASSASPRVAPARCRLQSLVCAQAEVPVRRRSVVDFSPRPPADEEPKGSSPRSPLQRRVSSQSAGGHGERPASPRSGSGVGPVGVRVLQCSKSSRECEVDAEFAAVFDSLQCPEEFFQFPTEGTEMDACKDDKPKRYADTLLGAECAASSAAVASKDKDKDNRDKDDADEAYERARRARASVRGNAFVDVAERVKKKLSCVNQIYDLHNETTTLESDT